MTLRWSKKVAPQLKAIYGFIAEGNPAAAASTIHKIITAAEHLVHSPLLGKTGRLRGTRELISPPFIIVYRKVEDVINIEAVFHGNQRF
jgi:addiction module RelE/StbE family toxin